MITFDLKIGKGRNGLEFSEEYKELIQASCELLLHIINLPDFRTKVHNYTWTHKREGLKEGFHHTSDSRELVYEKIMSGDDNFTEEFEDDHNVKGDKDIDIWIIPYYGRKKKVVGMTNRKTYRTWLNLKHWNQIPKSRLKEFSTKIGLAKNIIHEYCHNLGYGHKGNKRYKHYNEHSVPYGIGRVIDEIVENGFKEQFENGLNIMAALNDDLLESYCSFTTDEEGQEA